MQSEFSKALLNSSTAVPAGLAEPQSFDSEQRFNVYRNNVLSSLIEALRQSFPVVCALVGEEAFAKLAAQYVTHYPPKSAYLFEYGDQFGLFLESKEELRSYPYMAEVAQLEYQILCSTHAGDAPPTPGLLEALCANPPLLAQTRFIFAPSFKLLAFTHASASIWAAHQQSLVGLDSVNVEQPEWLMLSRPNYSVELDWLEIGEFEFLQALCRGERLEDALDRSTAPFDLAACFQRLIERKVLIGERSI